MTVIRNEAPAVSATDRLGLTLFLAAALHAIVILGITFHAPKGNQKPLSLEVTLVHSQSEQEPEKADFLAQANQQGGGNVDENVRPSSPFPNPRPNQEQGTASETRELAAPRPQPENRAQVLTAPKSEKRAPVEQKNPAPPVPDVPEAAELVNRSIEIARLSAEIRQSQEAYAKRPRQEYITANTREHVTAAYEEAWRTKVERVGNLNYPNEAKRKNLSGVLVLDVAIAADGRLVEAKVVRSSGHPALDDGAMRIVRLAAPFAPFPDSMRERMDIVHIIRAWQFESDNSFSTRR